MPHNKFNNQPYEVHRLVYDRISPDSKVLDIGCASGYFAKQLKKKKCLIWGLEKDPKMAKKASKYMENIWLKDLDKKSILNIKEKFDYILILDVIEHLKKPQYLLRKISNLLEPDGEVIISTPNIAHISIRLNLLFGEFDYADSGILDRTHVHFYTKKTLRKLIANSGINIKQWNYSADFGQLPYLGRVLKNINKKIQYMITRISPTLLSPQFIVICKR